jgi:DNA-binding ferritin-like protein
MKNVSEVVAGLQELFNQVKYFHWQTKSLAQHEALGDAFDDLEDLIDDFVEVAMGKYGRPTTKNQKFEMFDLEDVDIMDWSTGVVDYLISFDDVLDETQDTDLLNIRDEMMAVFNKVKYLLTLKESNMKNKKVIKLTEADLHRIVERVINEQTADTNRKKAIQCFLNKKGVKDDAGQSIKIDGLIGNYPNSKSAQAIVKYQTMIKVYPVDGVWGPDTESKMNPQDKKIFKECQNQHGDLMDKIVGGISNMFGFND